MLKLRHDISARGKHHAALAERQQGIEEKYQGWLSKIESRPSLDLARVQSDGRPWWQHVFTETASAAHKQDVAPEAALLQVERVLQAEEKVAQAAWEGSKAEKRAEYMLKVAKSDAEKAYADRMITRAKTDTAAAKAAAAERLPKAGGSGSARAEQARRRLRMEGKAWYHQEVAQGELRALRQMEKASLRPASTIKQRVSPATSKREAMGGSGAQKEALHRARKRWQRTGQQWRRPVMETYRTPKGTLPGPSLSTK